MEIFFPGNWILLYRLYKIIEFGAVEAWEVGFVLGSWGF